MRVGVVGATGQVGSVMRAVLAEREFPVDEIRYFASARSVGRTLPWNGRRRSRSRTRPPPIRRGLDIALFSAGATGSKALAPRFTAARRDRHRQLLRVADGPRRAARRLRGQPAHAREHPEGHRRQPELHDDGRHAGAQAAARRGRAEATGHEHLPGGVGRGARRRRRVRRAGAQGRRPRVGTDLRR